MHRYALPLFAASILATPAAAEVQVTATGPLVELTVNENVEAEPDLVTVSAGVTTQARTAVEAMRANATQMTAVVERIKALGLPERDIQTSNVSVYPQQQYREGQAPLITGYQANNTVTAKVRRIDNTGRVIDAAVNAGGNTVNGVYFSYQDPDAQLDAARRDAIAEARRRAELYASALGMRVHRIVAVQEGGGFAPPIPVAIERMAAQDARPPTPIAPGETLITAPGLPSNRLPPCGRDATSIAFLRTPGTPRLYSGVTNTTPSACRRRSRNAVHSRGGSDSRSSL